MFPAHCGEWEYTDHKDVGLLVDRCAKLLARAQTSAEFTAAAIADTRSCHADLFQGLTLPDQDYLAGNYRGSEFECLKERPAFIGTTQGCDPSTVAATMDAFHEQLLLLLRDLADAASRINKKKKKGLTEGEYLHAMAEGLANVLECFFTIHPYANGNGHIGRFIVWLSFIRLKRYPRLRWPLNDRPPYDEAVQQHREGNPEPLRRLLLKTIRGI